MQSGHRRHRQKGHLVKEIDALGGVMARAAGPERDTVSVPSMPVKGPRGTGPTRAQIDRSLYKGVIRPLLEQADNLQPVSSRLWMDMVIEGDRIKGVVTQTGLRFLRSLRGVDGRARFLAGRIHVGETGYQGGRAGEPPANTLAARLRDLPFRTARLKTGTPPRLDGRDHRLRSTQRANRGGRSLRRFFFIHGND